MDLNTLISTIVSSTAALVAIIGGFLVSRVIALSSEQNGVKRRIREINNDLYAKQELISNLEKYLLEDDVTDFFRDNIVKILKAKPLVEIINEDEYNYRTEDELKPYLDEFLMIIKELYELIDKVETIPDEFFDFYREQRDLKLPHRIEWYKVVYDEIYSSNQQNHFGYIPTLNFKPSNIPLVNTDYKDSLKERDRLVDDIRVLELHKKEQKKILGDYGKPQWIWGGLFVLGYACIVGIVYPITLLPYPKDSYNDGLTKFVLLALFFSQLVALFIYLGIAMYKITHQKKEYS